MQTTLSDHKRLFFLQGKKTLIVQSSQIIRMEAFSNYTYVYFTDHPPLLMAKVLHLYDELLRPHGFVRTHKSHLINPLFVKELDKKGTILMRDNTIIDIARRRKRNVTKIFADVETRFIASQISNVETRLIVSQHPKRNIYIESSKKLVS
jgi:two-component system, LytTR family, response regulator